MPLKSTPNGSAAPTPSPDSLTLRLRHSRTILLLHTSPTATFLTLKATLLSALSDLPADSQTRQALPALPSDPSHIALAVLVDKNNPASGWVPLEIPETEVEDADNPGEKKVVGGDGSPVNRDVKSAGLKDGSLVAFRFLSEEELQGGEAEGRWEVVMPMMGEEMGDGEMEDEEDEEA